MATRRCVAMPPTLNTYMLVSTRPRRNLVHRAAHALLRRMAHVVQVDEPLDPMAAGLFGAAAGLGGPKGLAQAVEPLGPRAMGRIRRRPPVWIGAILRRRQHKHPPLSMTWRTAPPAVGPDPSTLSLLRQWQSSGKSRRLNAGCLRLPLCLTVAFLGGHPRSRTTRTARMPPCRPPNFSCFPPAAMIIFNPR